MILIFHLISLVIRPYPCAYPRRKSGIPHLFARGRERMGRRRVRRNGARLTEYKAERVVS
jgi:hypothetical protein